MTVRSPSERVRAGAKAKDPADVGARPARRVRGAAWLLTFLAVLGGAHALVLIGAELVRNYQISRSIRTLSADVAVLEAEVGGLAGVLDHGADVRYLEQLARKQGYLYPDEILIVPRR